MTSTIETEASVKLYDWIRNEFNIFSGCSLYKYQLLVVDPSSNGTKLVPMPLTETRFSLTNPTSPSSALLKYSITEKQSIEFYLRAMTSNEVNYGDLKFKISF